ncbi:hypothetical protein DAI22_10g026601 [Oryza sativa Japonica Group]|nr:hypothetical protein DAI22_10g026601 [Oryza sativa Japonica Group]
MKLRPATRLGGCSWRTLAAIEPATAVVRLVKKLRDAVAWERDEECSSGADLQQHS